MNMRLQSASSSRTSTESLSDIRSEGGYANEESHTANPKMTMIGLIQLPKTPGGRNSSRASLTKRTVYLKDNVLSPSSGGYFLVKDDTGMTYCRIHGEAATAQNSGFDVPKVFYKNVKVFTDGWGRPLFTMKRKPMSIHQTSQVFDLSGKALLQTKSKFSFTKNRMTATFANCYDGRLVQVEVLGKFTSRDAAIKLSNGQLLGRIRRSGLDEYALEICPGVDLVLLVVIAVAFSERGQDNNRSAWTT